MLLDLKTGYEGLLKLGSGWAYNKPPRYSIEKASQDMRRVKEILYPNKDQIFIHEVGELRPWDNSVTKRHINLNGGQGSGKGHTARWIARWGWMKYQEDPARLQRAEDDDSPVTPNPDKWGQWVAQGLDCIQEAEGYRFDMNADPWFSATKDPERINELLLGLDHEAAIQFVFAEDLTSALDKLARVEKNEAASSWFKIRHKLRDATGHQEGLIIGILGLHRFHGVPPPFTTDIDMMIFKSSSSNPHDAGIIRQYVGGDGMKFLQLLEQERINDPIFKGYGIWYHRGEVGVWYNPVYPGSDPFQQLEYHQLSALGVTPMSLVPGEAGSRQPVTVGDFLVEAMGGSEDPEFFEEILDLICKDKADEATAQRDRAIFRLSVSGEVQNTIAAQHGVSPARISQIVRGIKERELGYVGELAYSQRYPDLEYIGGNAHEPDFLDHEARRVISFKTYHEPALRATTLWICKRVGLEEMRYSQAHGYELEMLIYEMAQRCFFRYRFTHQGAAEPQDPEEQPPETDPDLEWLNKLNRGMQIKAMFKAGLLPKEMLPEDLKEDLDLD